MKLYDSNKAKISELLPNCAARAMKCMDEAFALGWNFRISEAYRTQYQQCLYFTQNRTLGQIEGLYRSKFITPENYHVLKDIYANGKNIVGDRDVTKTLNSKHTRRVAIDVYPVALPDPAKIEGFNFDGTLDDVRERLIRYRLMELEKLWKNKGVYRPPETLSFGDYYHFEIYNEPLPLESPEIAKRREERLKKQQEDALLISRAVARRKAETTSEPKKSRIIRRLSSSPI